MANFFNKKKLIVALASAAISVFAVAAAGCQQKVEQISIGRNNAPQTNYVLGQDLNLSSGKLTVIVKGERTEIPLSDPEISISGYNKDKLGKQTLKVEYMGQSTALTVNVYNRIEVSGHEEAYFVGESMDKTKGQLTITADNGERSIALMKDPAVTVSGFDSSAENANLPVTISYQNYSGTINIGIYDVETIQFGAPTKRSYKSHETKLDLTGCYMTLKSAELTRNIEVTADMVKGFDLSAATVEHREDGLSQMITVDYCGYQKEYEIEVKFSDYSLIALRSSEMDDLEWTSTELPDACTELMGENAMEAMAIYFVMPKDEFNMVSTETIEPIVKVASVYGLDKWMKEFETYNDAFFFNEAGSLSWNCAEYESTKDAYEKVKAEQKKEEGSIIYHEGATLDSIRTTFAETVLFGEELIGGYLTSLLAPSTIDSFLGQLELMLNLHVALQDIPNEWTLDMLKTEYADEIYTAWELLHDTTYKATQQRSLYYLTSSWREKNDFFDILYAFYFDYYMFDNENPYPSTDPNYMEKHPLKGDLKWMNAFKDLRLPGVLEVLYEMLLNTRNELLYINQGYRAETTNFMIMYENALALKDQILASNDTMAKTLYSTLEFDYLINNSDGSYTMVTFDTLFMQFRRATNGYVHNFNAYLGVDAYEKVWEDYSSLLMKISTDSQTAEFDVLNYGEEIENLFMSYMALTPKQQYGFMTLLHPYYLPTQPGYRYPMMAWSNDGTFQSQFTYLIYTYYEKVLPESTHEIFTQLLLAQESLAGLELFFDATAFRSYMDQANSLIEYVSKRNKTDWQEFNNKLSDFMMMMESYDAKFGANSIVYEELTEQEESLMFGLLSACFEAYCLRMLYQWNGSGLTIAFAAAMERVEEYTAVILESKNPALLRAYYFEPIGFENVVYPDNSQGPYGGFTLDLTVWQLRDAYTDALTSAGYDSAERLVYDVYVQLNVQEFLADAAYLYYNRVVGKRTAENPYKYADTERVLAIMESFRQLTIEQKHFIFTLDGQYRFYLSALVEYGQERNAKMNSLLEALANLEYTYVFAMMNPDAVDPKSEKTYTQILQEAYTKLLTEYAKLEQKVEKEKLDEKPDEKLLAALEDFNTYFGDMYGYYIEVCGEMFPDVKVDLEEDI